MRFAHVVHRCLLPGICLALIVEFAVAAPPSDVLLPSATKGYVAVARAQEAKDRFAKTQFGQLLNDKSMDEFVVSLRKQLEDKFGVFKDRLGVTYSDIEPVPSGELALAIIERPEKVAALAIIMGVAGRDAEVKQLLESIDKRFSARGGMKRTVEADGATLLIFDVPPKKQGEEAVQAVYFLRDGVLCGVNGRDQAEAMLKRFSGTPRDNLSSVVAYQQTMERCRRAARGAEPEIRWFAEPFTFIWASRTVTNVPPLRPDKDILKILEQQGFDAIRGIGGQGVMLAPGGVDFLYRMSIYAPPVEGQENDPLRWNLAMRMLQTPNTTALVPQSWAPRMCARYATYSVDILNAFDHFGTLFDAMEGHENAFQTSMEGIEKDAFGPQVNIRDEFVAHMGKRITLVTDYSTPISTKSERSVIAIEAKDEAKLAATLARIMEKEPDVVRREFRDYVIWERVPESVDVAELTIDTPGLSPLHVTEEVAPEEPEAEAHVLPNSAVCVALGQLMMASDIAFLEELLGGFGQRELLTSSGDYQQVAALMDSLAPKERCGWSFVRTDEAFRPTYELIRQGRMPEAETMFGRFLNEMLTTEVEKEEGIRRKQRLDGSALPDFEMVRRYFGPAGRVLVSEQDGWILTGALMDKEAPPRVAERP